MHEPMHGRPAAGLRPGLPALPPRMRHLPVDKRGFPVPWFVGWVDGAPDFRTFKRDAISTAWKRKSCWLCGETLGVHKTAVVGPMCAVNRVTSEPPCHLDCAVFAAQACPFITNPDARRRSSNMPDDSQPPPGIAIPRNPGVVCLWTTREVKPFKVKGGPGPGGIQIGGGVLFRLGEPSEVRWFARGRTATRDEVEASIASGRPILDREAEWQGAAAKADLARGYAEVTALLPAAA